MSNLPAEPIHAAIREYAVYPASKPSGVEWLGDVPEHWRVRRLRFLCDVNPSKAEVGHIPKSTMVSFLPMELIDENGELALTETRMITQIWQGFTYFRDGDVLLAKITPCFENGKGALCEGLVNGFGFGTTELHVLRPHSHVFSKFLFYITRTEAFRLIGQSMMYGAAGQQRVPIEFVYNWRVGLPPLNEQRAIAAFLDRETALIDELIDLKRQLIERLREQRAALISQAVTRGLDPNVPMKDSGVKWLGEIPESWKLTRMKFITSKIGSGKTPLGGSEVYVNENVGVLFLRSQNVHFDGLRLEDAVYITEAADKSMLSTRVLPNDVLLNITGASLGRSCIVPERFPLANVNQHVVILRPAKDKVHPEFLQNVIVSKIVQSQIFSVETGASREGLTFFEIANLFFALPASIEEQEEMSDRINRLANNLDSLIGQVQEAITSLHEQRTALIAAAVTGKIDVRGEVA